ncbi:MAG: hypothetical protein P8127_14790 [Acidobacteriota bacterium]
MALIGGAVTQAQEPLDLETMGAMMRRNQEEIRQYTWNSRMTLFVNDQQRRTDTFTVRILPNGSVEKMQTGSDVAKGKVRGPDGKKLSKKELEAAREFVLRVKDQLGGYLNPMFAEKAVNTSSVKREEGKIILESHDVMATGDTVVITIWQATARPAAAEIDTVVDGSPVSLEVMFDSIEYGPNYPSRSVTTSAWNGMKVTIVAENSNYKPGG